MAIFYQFAADGLRGSVTHMDDSYVLTKGAPIAPEGVTIIRHDAGLPDAARWLVGDAIYFVQEVETEVMDADGNPVMELVIDDRIPPIVVGG